MDGRISPNTQLGTETSARKPTPSQKFPVELVRFRHLLKLRGRRRSEGPLQATKAALIVHLLRASVLGGNRLGGRQHSARTKLAVGLLGPVHPVLWPRRPVFGLGRSLA